jgi:hypothetical protein
MVYRFDLPMANLCSHPSMLFIAYWERGSPSLYGLSVASQGS